MQRLSPLLLVAAALALAVPTSAVAAEVPPTNAVPAEGATVPLDWRGRLRLAWTGVTDHQVVETSRSPTAEASGGFKDVDNWDLVADGSGRTTLEHVAEGLHYWHVRSGNVVDGRGAFSPTTTFTVPFWVGFPYDSVFPSFRARPMDGRYMWISSYAMANAETRITHTIDLSWRGRRLRRITGSDTTRAAGRPVVVVESWRRPKHVPKGARITAMITAESRGQTATITRTFRAR